MAERTVDLASSNSDVRLSPDSLSFTGGAAGNWETAQTVTVRAAQDADSSNDSASVRLTGDRIEDARVSVTVTDDDVALTLSRTALTVDEGDDETFRVRLATRPSAPGPGAAAAERDGQCRRELQPDLAGLHDRRLEPVADPSR